MLRGRPQHLRHDRRRLLRHLPLRPALVRRLPRRGGRRAHTFCIDLQYWYPAPKYRFRESTAGTLRNRDGETVSLEKRRRMAYAIWAYGRSGKPNQQAAVMLYVHAPDG